MCFDDIDISIYFWWKYIEMVDRWSFLIAYFLRPLLKVVTPDASNKCPVSESVAEREWYGLAKERRNSQCIKNG